ncbi:hypothetical protein RN001_002999 [Aquatica leii]|uniref:DUF4806 domain-containing protein n=1 Tax=Aquatica leii TaxID=1421715 RepID=A0AAN7QNU5_9COLE|nr:hypothetical protein RN001_002999 [Aquatica leii]
MFQVVEFHSGEVQVVPSNWIIDNKVFWSKTYGSVYARKGFAPKSTWKTYPCTIRCNSKSFETFEEALLKCKVLLDHTDSSSCALTDSDNGSGEKSRERSGNQHSDYEYYHDEDVDDIPDINDYSISKTLTPLPKTSVLSSATEDPVGNSVTSAAAGLDITDLFVPRCKCNETKDALLNEISKVQNAVDYNRRLIEQFITQMKREWDTIKIQVMSLNGQQKQQIDPLNSVFDELLPLTSIEDITICSELLEEGEKEKLFISKLSMIGGKDAKTVLNNIIKHCFTVEAQRLCNWSGANSKFKLKDAKLILILQKRTTDSVTIKQSIKSFEESIQKEKDNIHTIRGFEVNDMTLSQPKKRRKTNENKEDRNWIHSASIVQLPSNVADLLAPYIPSTSIGGISTAEFYVATVADTDSSFISFHSEINSSDSDSSRKLFNNYNPIKKQSVINVYDTNENTLELIKQWSVSSIASETFRKQHFEVESTNDLFEKIVENTQPSLYKTIFLGNIMFPGLQLKNQSRPILLQKWQK